MKLNAPVIGQWPNGKAFVLFDHYVTDQWGQSFPQRVCWTPTAREWSQVNQLLGGMAELTPIQRIKP